MAPRQAREQSGGEGGGDGAVLLVGPRPDDLVQRAERQPAAGQGRIDGGQPERHDASAKPPLLERLDALAQGAKLGIRRLKQGVARSYVRVLF